MCQHVAFDLSCDVPAHDVQARQEVVREWGPEAASDKVANLEAASLGVEVGGGELVGWRLF